MTTTKTRPASTVQRGPSAEEIAKQLTKTDFDGAKELWKRVRREVGRKEQADTRWRKALRLLTGPRAAEITELATRAHDEAVGESRGGRPPLAGEEPADAAKVTYAPGQQDLIRQLADELNVSYAQVVRELLDEALVRRRLRTKKDLEATQALRDYPVSRRATR